MKCFIILLVLKVWFVNTDWVKLPAIENKDIFLTEDSYLMNKVKGPSISEQPMLKVNMDAFIEYENISKDRHSSVKKIFPSAVTTSNPYTTLNHLINKETSNSSKIFLTQSDENPRRNDLIVIEDDALHIGEVNDVSSGFSDSENSKSQKGSLNLNHIANILKHIQASIFSNIPHAIKNKKDYLTSIQDRILLNIEDRIKVLWPSQNRQARGHKGEDQHLDFPSAETALMTIGFLTFAVFLIKLVLQVINALKAKKMMYFTPVATTMGRSYQNRQQAEIETAARIIEMMENFKRHR